MEKMQVAISNFILPLFLINYFYESFFQKGAIL